MVEADEKKDIPERTVKDFFKECIKPPQTSRTFMERSWERFKVYGILLVSGGITATTITEDPLFAVYVFGNGVYMAHRLWGTEPEDPESWGDIAA